MKTDMSPPLLSDPRDCPSDMIDMLVRRSEMDIWWCARWQAPETILTQRNRSLWETDIQHKCCVYHNIWRPAMTRQNNKRSPLAILVKMSTWPLGTFHWIKFYHNLYKTPAVVSIPARNAMVKLAPKRQAWSRWHLMVFSVVCGQLCIVSKFKSMDSLRTILVSLRLAAICGLMLS